MNGRGKDCQLLIHFVWVLVISERRKSYRETPIHVSIPCLAAESPDVHRLGIQHYVVVILPFLYQPSDCLQSAIAVTVDRDGDDLVMAYASFRGILDLFSCCWHRSSLSFELSCCPRLYSLYTDRQPGQYPISGKPERFPKYSQKGGIDPDR